MTSIKPPVRAAEAQHHLLISTLLVTEHAAGELAKKRELITQIETQIFFCQQKINDLGFQSENVPLSFFTAAQASSSSSSSSSPSYFRHKSTGLLADKLYDSHDGQRELHAGAAMDFTEPRAFFPDDLPPVHHLPGLSDHNKMNPHRYSMNNSNNNNMLWGIMHGYGGGDSDGRLAELRAEQQRSATLQSRLVQARLEERRLEELAKLHAQAVAFWKIWSEESVDIRGRVAAGAAASSSSSLHATRSPSASSSTSTSTSASASTFTLVSRSHDYRPDPDALQAALEGRFAAEQHHEKTKKSLASVTVAYTHLHAARLAMREAIGALEQVRRIASQIGAIITIPTITSLNAMAAPNRHGGRERDCAWAIQSMLGALEKVNAKSRAAELEYSHAQRECPHLLKPLAKTAVVGRVELNAIVGAIRPCFAAPAPAPVPAPTSPTSTPRRPGHATATTPTTNSSYLGAGNGDGNGNGNEQINYQYLDQEQAKNHNELLKLVKSVEERVSQVGWAMNEHAVLMMGRSKMWKKKEETRAETLVKAKKNLREVKERVFPQIEENGEAKSWWEKKEPEK